MDAIALIALLGLAFLLVLGLYWMALREIGELKASAAYDAEIIRDLHRQLDEAHHLIRPFDLDLDGRPGGSVRRAK